MMAPKDATVMNNTSQTSNAAQTATSNINQTSPEDPFEGREFNGYVFRDRHDRNFFIGRMTRAEQEKWLRDHPDGWQTREEFLRQREARAGTDVDANAAGACSTTTSANTVQPTNASEGPLLADEEPRPDTQAPNTGTRTVGNPEATNPATPAAGEEIVIEGRRLLSEPRFAERLGCSLRTLQRRRKTGKGPPSSKIGRKVYYDLTDVQEWIDRGKTR
jgi:predicted DNA-binding transcriptional regulator AlpA